MKRTNTAGPGRQGVDIVPTFIIPGAPKAGTTYVSNILAQHPDVFIPLIKETHFFSTDPVVGRYNRGYEYYRELLLPGKDYQHIGDASVTYLRDKESPQLISQYVPDAKFIVCLRNPIERTYSHYWADIKGGEKRLDFAEALCAEEDRVIELIDMSRYEKQLPEYLVRFAKEQILVLLQEDLRTDPQGCFQRICDFLDLPPLPSDVNLHARVNPGYIPRSSIVARLLSGRGRAHQIYRHLPHWAGSAIRDAVRYLRILNGRPGGYPPMEPNVWSKLADEFTPTTSYVSDWLERDLTYWTKQR